MAETMLEKNRINRNSLFAAAVSAIGLIALFLCSRDNPFDPNSSSYKPGAKPKAFFLKDTISCFIRDSVAITVTFSDSASKGGGTPSVDKLYFSWSGDTLHWSDSISVSGSDTAITIARNFLSSQDTFAYVRAKDNDGALSLLDSTSRVRLIVNGAKLVITEVVKSRDSVLIGDTVSFSVSAQNNGNYGTITDFVWTINGHDTTTKDSVLKTVFSSAGTQQVLVKVQSNDSAFSATDTIKIVVNTKYDAAPPEITFISPQDSAVVTSPIITILVRVKDQSGTQIVLINNHSATEVPGGTDTLKMWKDTAVQLNEGPTTIPIYALDRSTNPYQNEITKVLVVTYVKQDVTPPDLRFTSPLSNDTVFQSPRMVVVSATDPSGVAWVKCNNDTMSNTSGSSYSLNVALKEGKDTLFISAADKKGNTVTDTLVVTYIITDKVPPVVQIIKPAHGEQIATDFVQVRVTATDAGSGIDTVFINGQAATLSVGHYVLNVPLKHGFDTIFVVAFDASANHNKTKDSIVVIRNNPPRFVPDSLSRDTTLFKDSAATIHSAPLITIPMR